MNKAPLLLCLFLFALFSFSFAQGPPQINNTLVSGPGISNALPGQPAFIYMELRDSKKGNITDCVTFNMSVTSSDGSVTVTPSQVCNNGFVTASYILKMADTYTLSITYQNQSVPGSPFSVKCKPGPIYPPNSIAKGDLNGGIAGQSLYFNITAYDNYGNANTSCSGINIWKIALTGVSTSSGTVLNCTNGVYTAKYSASVTGGYDMVVSFNNQYLNGSPFRVSMTPGALYPPNCKAIGPGASAAFAGTITSFNVNAVDRYNNRIYTCQKNLNWTVNLQGPGPSKSFASTCSQGVYTLSYRVTIAGNYKLYVAVNGTGIATNGQVVVVSAKQVISASNTVASGPGLTTANAGLPAAVNITAYDQFNNRITSCSFNTADFDLKLTPKTVLNATQCFYQFVGCTDGVFTAQYYCYQSDNYTLSITYIQDPISGNPFHPTVYPGTINGPTSTASGLGLSLAFAGAQATFTIFAYDQYMNKVTQCPGKNEPQFVITLDSSQISVQVNGSILSCQDGNFVGAYTLTQISTYLLKVTYNGFMISGAPFHVITKAGFPYAPFCTFYGPGLIGTVAGQQTTFSATCRDKYKNPITECYDYWGVNLTGPVHFFGSTVSCVNKTGSLANTTFAYQGTVAGAYELDLDFDEDLVRSWNIVISPAAFDPSSSRAVGAGVTSQSIVAGNQTSFLILAQDRFGNNLTQCINSSSLNIQFTPSITSAYVFGKCQNGNQLPVTYSSTLASVYSIKITYKNQGQIKNSPYSVTIIPGPLYAATSTAGGIGLFNATAGKNAKLSIQAKDQYNNTITSCLPKSAYGDFQIAFTVPNHFFGQVFTCLNGVYGAQYNVTVAGNTTMTIEYNNVQIKNSPFHPYVWAGDNVDSKAVLSGPGAGDNGPIGAGVQVPIYVQPKDQFGNNIVVCDLDNDYWQLYTSGPQFITVSTSTCNQGIYTMLYSLKNTGAYKVVVYGLQSNVSNSPRQITVVPGPAVASQSLVYPFSSAYVGEQKTFQVVVHDQFGNNITTCQAGLVWNVTAQQDDLSYDGSVTCTGKGNYVATIQVFETGKFNIKVWLNGQTVPSMFTAKFLAGFVSTKYSIAIGDGVTKNASNIAGRHTTFYIVSYNQFGVYLKSGQLCTDSSFWTVTITPAFSAYQSNLHDIEVFPCNDKGMYKVRFNATTALQYYTVKIALNGTALPNTYQTQILPAKMDPSMTIVSGLNGTSADNGTFYVQTRDRFGNNEFTASLNDFGVRLSPFCANSTLHKTLVGGGKIQVYYEIAEGGLYCVAINYKQQSITIADSQMLVVGGTACGGCSQQGFCFRTVVPSTSTEEYSCSCFQGYVGDDCSDKLSSTYPLAVGAIIGLVVGIGILMLIIGVIIGFVCLRRLRRGEDNRPFID